MNVSPTGTPTPAVSPEATPVQQQAQVLMLKKSLDVQKDQAAQLLKLLEGKGQHLDLRV